MECSFCNKKYPAMFFAPLFSNGKYCVVDPECALAITNQIHGMNRTEFQGEMANELLTDFREWKRKNENGKQK